VLAVAWLAFAALLFASVRRVRVLADVLGVGPSVSVDSRATGASAASRDSGAAPGEASAAARAEAPVASTPRSRLTVVVAARDEQEEIGQTVGRLLEQEYEGLQVVVVDDRSKDATGAILDRIARSPAAHGRLEVVHNAVLPAGWLGKCHACALGAKRALGDWILFTDGDVTLARGDLLARVVGWAERERIDHLAVIPDMGPIPPLQSALMAAFGQTFLTAARCWEMDMDLPRGGAGIGAFNLVRRSAYEAIGGHDILRMDPADDVKLGQLLKESGARQRIFNGYGLVLCPWHAGTANTVRGLEKNAFAGLGYSLPLLIGFTAAALLLAWGPPLLALTGVLYAGPKAGALAAGAALAPWILQVFLLLLGWAAATRRVGASIASVILYPAGVAALLVAMWHSAIVTLSRGGIEWRGTFYPLAELRAGLVRPGRWRGRAGIPSGSA
jgi:hypothetical protein